MDINEKLIVAVFSALFLLSFCVLLFASSFENSRLQGHLSKLLWCFGVLPGFGGVLWGFFEFVTQGQPSLTMFAFLLLQTGSLALLRALKTIKQKFQPVAESTSSIK